MARWSKPLKTTKLNWVYRRNSQRNKKTVVRSPNTGAFRIEGVKLSRPAVLKKSVRAGRLLITINTSATGMLNGSIWRVSGGVCTASRGS